jgi:hypothetical protein
VNPEMSLKDLTNANRPSTALDCRYPRAAAYVWFLTWQTPSNGGVLKTPHTMEIPFALYSFDKAGVFVGDWPQLQQMAEQIAGAWVAFAKTGKPNHPDIPPWPAFDANKRPVMEFNLKSRVVNDPSPNPDATTTWIPARSLRGIAFGNELRALHDACTDDLLPEIGRRVLWIPIRILQSDVVQRWKVCFSA